MVKVKICGITNLEDAIAACEAGADFIGFLFAEESPRFIGRDKVKAITGGVKGNVGKVGLFKDQDVAYVAESVKLCGLDHVQLHGSETPEYCSALKKMIAGRDHRVKILKTFKVKDKIMGTEPENYSDADHYLFDTYHPKMMGGTGIKFDWDVLKGRNFGRPVFLAGGLDPVNVREAVISLRPYAVDVSSGIESSQGKKDVKKVKEFIHNAKTA